MLVGKRAIERGAKALFQSKSFVYQKFSTLNPELYETNNFFKLSSPSLPILKPDDNIVGEVIDRALNLTNIRPGEVIDIPYEVTISHSMRDFWQSAFYSHDRINTSTPFARSLGLQDQVVPFHLMLFLAGSMSHAGIHRSTFSTRCN